MTLSVYVVPTICEPLVSQPIVACVGQHPHLKGLELADVPDAKSCTPIDMLVGSDYYWELVTGSICRGVSGPTAIHTKLRWVLSGPACSNPHNQCTMNMSITHVLHIGASEESNDLVEQLWAFWELETLGIRQEESTWYNQFEGTVRFENGRYKEPLMWKEYHEALPDNYQLSLSRLHGLLRRLRQDPVIFKEYDGVIKEQFEKGIIEAVPTDEPSTVTVHYLPHHAVICQDKSTTRLRIVYDASAKSARNPSLNDCLLKGPSLNQLAYFRSASPISSLQSSSGQAFTSSNYTQIRTVVCLTSVETYGLCTQQSPACLEQHQHHYEVHTDSQVALYWIRAWYRQGMEAFCTKPRE